MLLYQSKQILIRRAKMKTNENPKKTIAIIFGGCSPEYSVSLQSATAVINHLDRRKYIPVLLGITAQGDWYLFHGDTEKIANDTWFNANDCTPIIISPNRTHHAILKYTEGQVGEVPVDAVFPILHGRNGEDGTVQGMFELMGIPVVGCGVFASALCMDKDRAHKLAHAAGITVPHSYCFDKHTDIGQAFFHADEIGYPLFVKPVKAGSSFGISKINSRSELSNAIKSALEYDDTVIIEESIPGFEVGCAIFGNNSLTIGEVDEIELSDGFFNNIEKYTLKTSAIHVPARIDDITAFKIKETAKTIYRALGCQGFARVDMFLTPSNQIIFNEVNTIPGFTAHSRFPNMLMATGLSFEQIISRIIESATCGGKSNEER